jgi:hypothetical protein
MPITRDRFVRLLSAAQDFQQAFTHLSSSIAASLDREPNSLSLIRLNDLHKTLLLNPTKTISTIAEEVRNVTLGKRRTHYTEELLSPPTDPDYMTITDSDLEKLNLESFLESIPYKEKD